MYMFGQAGLDPEINLILPEENGRVHRYMCMHMSGYCLYSCDSWRIYNSKQSRRGYMGESRVEILMFWTVHMYYSTLE